MSDVTDLEIVLRLAAAGLVGALIGLERESRQHSAGVRTHALVAFGAALFSLAGAYGFADVTKGPNVDPARIAAQVASGIGFIGAGAIIRHGASVRGLTTAATLWVSAALGVALAAGLLVVTLAGLLIAFVTLVGLRLLTPRVLSLMGSDPHRVLRVEYERGHGTLGPLIRDIEGLGAELDAIRIEDDETPLGEPGVRAVSVELLRARDAELTQLVEQLKRRPEVRSAEWHAGSR